MGDALPLGLRLSTMAPTVETSLEQVGELVKLMQSGGAGLSDTQSQRLVGYMGSLEDMRGQLGVMSQYYEDDEQVLSDLTLLMDRIDESLGVANKSNAGFTHEEKGENLDGSLQHKEEESILRQSIKQGSMTVSVSQSLGASLLPWLFAEEFHKLQEEDEDDDGGDEWDHPLTEHDLAQLETISLSSGPTNLAQSFMEDSGEFQPPPVSLLSSAASSSKQTTKKKIKGECDPTLCRICYEEYNDWSELCSLSNCEHIYCKECISGHLHTRIISGGVLDLICPSPGCHQDIDILDIYSVCSQDTLDKYERFILLANLRADPNVRWCPMPSCSAPVKGPPKDNSPWITCETCNLQVCFQCGDERHDPAACGKEAKELIGKRRNEIQSAEDMFEEWHKGKPTDVKACPKCKAYIEKNQGCNHMTCKGCSYQFCWLCLEKFEPNNHFNNDLYPDCKGKQYWYPPVPPDPELAQRYNWIYFPPNYQYAGVDDGPLGGVSRGPTQGQRIRTTAKKVGIYVGVGVAVVTLGIPAAVIGGPIYGVFRIHKAMKRKRRQSVANPVYY